MQLKLKEAEIKFDHYASGPTLDVHVDNVPFFCSCHKEVIFSGIRFSSGLHSIP